MNDVVGYAFIKKNATTGIGAKDIDKFKGEVVRVYEFAKDGGVLVLNREATELCMFDACDVQSKFECTVNGDYVCPPGLCFTEQMAYATKCHLRKGGYSPLLKQMVIHASLHKGKFTDSMLWSLQ